MTCVGPQGGPERGGEVRAYRQTFLVSYAYDVFFARGVFDPANPVRSRAREPAWAREAAT